MARTEITWKDKYEFLERYVKPSFFVIPDLPTNARDQLKARNDWMEKQAVEENWHSDLVSQLIRIYVDVQNIEMADKKIIEAKEEEIKERTAGKNIIQTVSCAV